MADSRTGWKARNGVAPGAPVAREARHRNWIDLAMDSAPGYSSGVGTGANRGPVLGASAGLVTSCEPNEAASQAAGGRQGCCYGRNVEATPASDCGVRAWGERRGPHPRRTMAVVPGADRGGRFRVGAWRSCLERTRRSHPCRSVEVVPRADSKVASASVRGSRPRGGPWRPRPAADRVSTFYFVGLIAILV